MRRILTTYFDPVISLCEKKNFVICMLSLNCTYSTISLLNNNSASLKGTNGCQDPPNLSE